MPAFLPLFLAAHSILYFAPPTAPAGTPLHIRLNTAVGTFASRVHAPVSAVLIAPVKADGETILPAGTLLEGEVKGVRRVGLGVIHETASLKLDFQKATLPNNGPEIPLATKMAAVDNGREVVTARGSIQKMRSTGSLGNRAAVYIRKALLWDVHTQMIVWAVKATIMQIPEPEIYLPTGTELTLTLSSSFRAALVPLVVDEPPAFTGDERERIASAVEALPMRTSAPVSERPSDMINVVFIGSRDQVAGAFSAAGWSEAQAPTVRSGFASAWAMVRNVPYEHAPMSSLLLNDLPADMNWQKGFDDVAKRHHIRLWEQTQTMDGQEIWAGAATRDTDFAYFRHGSAITHQIARLVDNEREKVAADLTFASCVDQADWIERPGIPHMMTNATGDHMETDGRVLVIRLNDCGSPRKAANLFDESTLPPHGGVMQRVLRRQIICLRSDFLRANPYWRGFEGARMLVSALRRRQVSDPDQPQQANAASRWFSDDLNTVISYR